jgi:hypothetical protein
MGSHEVVKIDARTQRASFHGAISPATIHTCINPIWRGAVPAPSGRQQAHPSGGGRVSPLWSTAGLKYRGSSSLVASQIPAPPLGPVPR